MQDNLVGFYSVGVIGLLFILGTGSLIVDTLLNSNIDTSPPQFEDKNNPNTKVSATCSNIRFLGQDDDLSIL